jgi:sRNA-binding carbon storage regulator CsrA
VLVLTRRANQSIMIGNDVVVTVLREAVYAELAMANQAAASPSAANLEQLRSLIPPKP